MRTNMKKEQVPLKKNEETRNVCFTNIWVALFFLVINIWIVSCIVFYVYSHVCQCALPEKKTSHDIYSLVPKFHNYPQSHSFKNWVSQMLIVFTQNFNWIQIYEVSVLIIFYREYGFHWPTKRKVIHQKYSS